MKHAFKQISKKMLSVVLAIAVVAVCLSVSFSVFAEDTAFKVTASSPLLPLKVEKAVDLDSIEVEFAGEFKAGDTLTWVVESGESASVTSKDQIVANSVGLTKFSASDGSNTQAVWVKVNAADDDDFSLVNLDFANESAFNDADWLQGSLAGLDVSAAFNSQSAANKGVMIARSGRYKRVADADKFLSWTKVPTASGDVGALKLPACSDNTTARIAIFKSPMMDDFKDYSVTAEMITQLTGDGDVNMYSEPGVLARVSANYNANVGEYVLSELKSVALRFRNFGALSLEGLATYDNDKNYSPKYISAPLFSSSSQTVFTAENAATEFQKDTATAGKVFTPAKKADEVLGKHVVEINFAERMIKYTLNGNVIFDPASNSGKFSSINMDFGEGYPASTAVNTGKNYNNGDWQYWATIAGYEDAAQYGTVGIANNYGADLYVYSLKATAANLAKGEMPTFVEPKEAEVIVIVTYDVADASPAIPLYVGKKIDLANINIMFGANKKPATGLTWTMKTGVSAKVEDGYLYGLKAGATGFTVTDGISTKNVWVIVNEQGNDNFALLDLDFSKDGAFMADDWLQGYAKNEKSNTTGDSLALMTGKYARVKDDERFLSIVDVTTADGASKALYFPALSGHGETRAVVYKNEMLKDFGNYNITAKLSNKNTNSEFTHSMSAAPGILARVNANYDAGVGEYILTETKSISFRFPNYGALGLYGLATYDFAKNTGALGYINVPLWGDLSTGSARAFTYYTVGTYRDYYHPQEMGDVVLNQYTPENTNIFFPDPATAEQLTVKTVNLELGANYAVKYTLNGNLVFDMENTPGKTDIKRIALGTGDADWDGALYEGSQGNTSRNAANMYASMFDQNIAGKSAAGAAKGTIGLVNNNGNDYYIHSIIVEDPTLSALTEETMPTMEDIAEDETVKITLVEQRKYDLNKLVCVADWTDAKTAEYQIKDGVLVALAEGNITVEGVRGEDTAVSVDFEVVAEDADYTGEAFVVAGAELICTDIDNNKYVLVPADENTTITSLTVNGEEIKPEADFDDDGIVDGDAFEFTCEDIFAAEIVAKISTVEANLKEFALLGATVKVKDQDFAGAIKFISRFPAIKAAAVNEGELSQVEGNDMTGVGALIIPTALLGGNDLVFGAEDVPTAEKIKIGEYEAINLVITKICNLTEQYADASIVLTMNSASPALTQEVADSIMADSDITVVPYMTYFDGEAYQYYYGDAMVRSYNQVLAAFDD